MSEPSSVQICTFRVGSLVCGILLQHVQEITGYHHMTPVPLAPDVVIGLINLRGQVVTVIDLRKRLALPARRDPRQSCNLVIRRSGGVVSLLIDEIGDVVQAEASALVEPPQTLSSRARRFVRAVLKTETELVLELDINTTTSLEL